MLSSARSVLLKKSSIEALPSSAMALYSFNEGSGLTSADLSGNNRTLSLNSASWDANGHTGAAITNSASITGGKATFVAPTAAITMIGWVKPLDLTAGTSHIAFGFFDNGNNTCCALWTQRADYGTPNVLQANIRISGGLAHLSSAPLTVGTWTHLALTYNGATVVVYQDGIPVSTQTQTGSIGTGDALCIASSMNGNYDTDVVVDDVRVYNIGLTPGQIITGMNTPVA